MLCLTIKELPLTCELMNKNQAGITKRFVAATLVTAAVAGVSVLSMHTPTHNPNLLTRPLKSIQTDEATLFQASIGPNQTWFVEQVLPDTRESKASTENLKLVAAAF